MQTVYLYSKTATPAETETHGLGAIQCLTANIFEEINGEYSCQISTYEKIETEQIVKLRGPDGPELFRLSKPERLMTSSGKIKYSAKGWHISYDLADDLILDRRFPGWQAAATVNAIVKAGITDRRFSGTSNISGAQTLNVIRLNPIQALIGDQDNSFLNRWGGEIYRHGYQIDMLSRRGAETGRLIQYRKNLTGLKIYEDADRTINRIVPTYLSAPTVAALLPEQYIDSLHVGETAHPHVCPIHFGDIEIGKEGYATKAIAESAVRERVAGLYAAGIDRPRVHADVTFVDLTDTGLIDLAHVGLGDGVKVRYESWTFWHRVIAYEWNALAGRYIRIELGEKRVDVAAVVQDMNTATRTQIKQTSGALAAKIDMNRIVSEAMGYKTEEREMSDGRIVTYYYDGATLETSSYIAYKPDPATFAWTNTGWNNGSPVWQYGQTKNGNAIYNILAAHKINADLIEAGVIKSVAKYGNNEPVSWLNLSNGTFSFGRNGVSYNGSRMDIYGDLYVDTSKGQRLKVSSLIDTVDAAAALAKQTADAANGAAAQAQLAAGNAASAASSAQSAANTAQITANQAKTAAANAQASANNAQSSASSAQSAASTAQNAAYAAQQAANTANGTANNAMQLAQYVSSVFGGMNANGYPIGGISKLYLVNVNGVQNLEVRDVNGNPYHIPLR